MTQFLNHKDDGTFMFYYTRPGLSGTPDFEHKVTMNLKDIKYGKKPDGSDDPDLLVVECPCGCGTVAVVPSNSGEEAKQLHSKHAAKIKEV